MGPSTLVTGEQLPRGAGTHAGVPGSFESFKSFEKER